MSEQAPSPLWQTPPSPYNPVPLTTQSSFDVKHSANGSTSPSLHPKPGPPQNGQFSPPTASSTILEDETIRSYARWQGAAKATLLSSRAILTLFVLASAIILTMFSSSGIVRFEGQVIKWKLLLYTLQLEAAIYVFMKDVLALGIDYLLVHKGMTRSQLGHALGVTARLWRVQGSLYKTLVSIVTIVASIVAPVLLSVVLVRQGSNLESAEDMLVSTNCIGGRIRDNFGATGQSYLFNVSEEKYTIKSGAEHYAVYEKAGTGRQVFVPKVPQIGGYSSDCNDDENVDVVGARVLSVEGLLYKCEPKVDEVSTPIEDMEEIGAGTSSDKFRLLEDSHRGDESRQTARFNVSFAIRKGQSSTAILMIPCDVVSAEANLDVAMTEDGVMGLSIVDGEVSELSLPLPPRVVGTMENELELALENSVGRKGIGIVSRWVATDNSLSEWDGLIRGVVASYGIRGALQETFADKDDKRNAINILKVSSSTEETQTMRIAVLWIPVGLAIFSRILTWIFPSIFTGGLRQVLTWVGVESGGAGGAYYSETGVDEVKERECFLNLNPNIGAVSHLGLADKRDRQIGLGSYRYVRRLTNRGVIRGPRLGRNGTEEHNAQST